VKLERTAYETEPVDNIGEAVVALVHAYNRLQDALFLTGSKWAAFGEALRAAVNKPVAAKETNGLQISLYEIGIAHAPDTASGGAGAVPNLVVNAEKLNRALEERADELEILFSCENAGLLPRLCQMLHEYKNNAPEDDALHTYWDDIYPPLVRFNNECRRLQAFWWE
jgi:flagellar capping protein FliD